MPDSAEHSKEQRESVEIQTISEYGYDLRTKMGTLLVAEKKVDFERIRNARSAWTTAFGKDATDIFDDPKHASVVSLEAVRNLLAHRGGIVDLQFHRQVKNI